MTTWKPQNISIDSERNGLSSNYADRRWRCPAAPRGSRDLCPARQGEGREGHSQRISTRSHIYVRPNLWNLSSPPLRISRVPRMLTEILRSTWGIWKATQRLELFVWNGRRKENKKLACQVLWQRSAVLKANGDASVRLIKPFLYVTCGRIKYPCVGQTRGQA